MSTYTSLTGAQLTQLLSATNTIVENRNAFSAVAGNTARQISTGGNFFSVAGAETDTTASANQTVPSANSSGTPVTVWYENAATTVGSIPTVNLTTNGHPDVIVLDTGAGINLVDLGSVGDTGDAIYGDSGTDSITLTQGNNVVDAGSGHTTVTAGSGADTIWGGGLSSIVGGSGDKQKLAGGVVKGANDTLVAGTGHDDTLWGGYGNVLMDGRAASGFETMIAGGNGKLSASGDDTMIGNGHTYFDLRPGSENVWITAGPNSSASDTIVGAANDIGNSNITTSAGNNFITLSGGYSTLDSGGNDSISMVNGGFGYVHATGSASDTVQFGNEATNDDVVYNQSSNAVTIDLSSDLQVQESGASTFDPVTGVPSLGGGSVASTTIQFTNGSILTYAGNVNIETSTKTF